MSELALIPPRLVEQGVTITMREGYRSLGIPAELRDKYNVINPTVELSQVNPDFTPMLREVRLSLDVDAYGGAGHHTKEECSPNKIGLYKLAEAAKISFDAPQRIPLTHLARTERLGWIVTARQRHSDGTETTFSGTATFDDDVEREEIEAQVKGLRLYEGGQRTNKPRFTPGTPDFDTELEKRWRQKVRKASELTETFAVERAIRGMLKLPHKLKKTQFAKPWLVVCYGFTPTSPEARAIAGRLYGVNDGEQAAVPAAAAQPALSPSPADHDVDDEPLEGEVVDEEPAANGGHPAGEDEAPAAGARPEPQPAEPPLASPGALQAAAEAAAKTKPPTGGFQDRTLAKINELPPGDADEWFSWALANDWSEHDAAFNGHVKAFVAQHRPHLLAT